MLTIFRWASSLAQSLGFGAGRKEELIQFKYFISLSFPESLQGRLANSRDALSREFGELVSRPMSQTKYHLTLGVILGSSSPSSDPSEIFSESLVPRLESILRTSFGNLSGSSIGRYSDGAVYMKIDDVHGVLNHLRTVIEAFCLARDFTLLPAEHFHVTIFRNNGILRTSQLTEEYKDPEVPLLFAVGNPEALDVLGMEQSGYIRDVPSLTKIYHAKVRTFLGQYDRS